MKCRGYRGALPRYRVHLLRRLVVVGLSGVVVIGTTSCGSNQPSPIRRGGGSRLSLAQEDTTSSGEMAVRWWRRSREKAGLVEDGPGTSFFDGSLGDRTSELETAIAPKLSKRARVIAFLPMSGSVSSMGKAVERGVACALQEGAAEERPELTVVDAGQEGDAPREALTAALKSASSPLAIVGPFLSSQIADVAALSSEYQVISFNLSKQNGAADDGVIDLGFSASAQIGALVRDGIIRAGISRLAIAKTRTPYSKELVAQLHDALKGTAIQIIFEGAYGDTKEFAGVKELVQKLEATAIDGLFVADNAPGASRLLSSMGGSLRSSVKIFGPGAWYNMKALSAAQGVFNNAIFPVPFVVSEGDERFHKLNRCLPTQRNREADFLSALGFDVGTIIALRRDGRLGEYNGLTGTFMNDERQVKRTLAVGVFVDGVIRPFRPVIRSLADVLSPGSSGNHL